MQTTWTARAIKGTIYSLVGGLMILAREPMLALVKGSDYDGAAVRLVFGVAAPILLLAGLYLIGTRHKT